MWHNKQTYQQARMSRDARFDGLFFVAVKTTGVYCRPICPAVTPKESNVTYFKSAVEAANAGYRPCLRCRPDSAPGSAAWQGVNTTFKRAIEFINQGELQHNSVANLSARLGISERYLRRLFSESLGVSPKQYALYQQCLFAKQLLHQTSLSVTQVALASGFNSIRRFNDCFKRQLGLTPTQVRRSLAKPKLELQLFYRPPYNWSHMQGFLSQRYIESLEWVSESGYGRTFDWHGCKGYFTAIHNAKKHCFDVTLELDQVQYLQAIVQNIRRVLDLDSDTATIEAHINHTLGNSLRLEEGLRLPGTWSVFEAGVRAILGQQVSVAAAHKLVTILVNKLGERIDNKIVFPKPEALANSSLEFFKMPGARKQTLINLAKHCSEVGSGDINNWLEIKGIGPWTVNYTRLRGLSDPDVLLDGDLGVKKAVQQLPNSINLEATAPWRSYLTFHLWNQL